MQVQLEIRESETARQREECRISGSFFLSFFLSGEGATSRATLGVTGSNLSLQRNTYLLTLCASAQSRCPQLLLAAGGSSLPPSLPAGEGGSRATHPTRTQVEVFPQPCDSPGSNAS